MIVSQPTIIGVLNVTPDSFSDGGQFLQYEAALSHAHRLSSEGAHLIELGGESTAPGSRPVSAIEELSRIEQLVSTLAPHHAVCVDTYKASVAQRCLELGACMINDVSALRADPEMLRVLNDHPCMVVLMHSKEADGLPHVSECPRDYKDVVEEVAQFLLQRAEVALRHGILEKSLILDPGMGRFISHDTRYSWELLSQYERLAERLKPFPLMVATSRKGFLGGKLEERDVLSQLTALIAVQKGAQFVRTHNVRMLQALQSTLKSST